MRTRQQWAAFFLLKPCGLLQHSLQHSDSCPNFHSTSRRDLSKFNNFADHAFLMIMARKCKRTRKKRKRKKKELAIACDT